MTSPLPELPDDIQGCHALIEQLRVESHAASGKAQIAQLEALLSRCQETIAEQEQTIENLAADNALLKRSLFGSRRVRFTDPAQTFLFNTTPDCCDLCSCGRWLLSERRCWRTIQEPAGQDGLQQQRALHVLPEALSLA